MSVKKTIFKNLGDLLKSRLVNLTYEIPAVDPEDEPTDEPLPDLKWFDKQMGQFDNPETSFALPLPTILLEFGQFVWTTTGQNNQKGEGSIRIYIYFENYANSFSGSLNQELALKYFEFTEAVHKVLQGYGIIDIMSPLVRIGDAEDIAQDMIITSVMDYSCTIFDNATDRSRNFIDVDPELTVEYKKESSRPAVVLPTDFLIT
jgi:hypothetical protein